MKYVDVLNVMREWCVHNLLSNWLQVSKLGCGHIMCAYLSNLNLKSCLRISKMCLVVFDGFISPVEAISTSVAMPMSSFKSLLPFDDSNNITLITTAQYF